MPLALEPWREADPPTRVWEPLGWCRMWVDNEYPDDLAASVYCDEGEWHWYTSSPWILPAETASGIEPTPEAARAAADKWLADYVARVGGRS